ncbi:hypothetical protein B0T24DRAFT_216275 [Lasiosphaeria ovina]|uniref:Uncharacterized protein n=1 Tax=Lasiosphaeria ovina TaxID=92902 RepID=A0AAE0KH75_9PEZI|nr:hypothetical protein B0T24DRAFT_216275 [Lasiosphaeria ovina]
MSTGMDSSARHNFRLSRRAKTNDSRTSQRPRRRSTRASTWGRPNDDSDLSPQIVQCSCSAYNLDWVVLEEYLLGIWPDEEFEKCLVNDFYVFNAPFPGLTEVSPTPLTWKCVSQHRPAKQRCNYIRKTRRRLQSCARATAVRLFHGGSLNHQSPSRPRARALTRRGPELCDEALGSFDVTGRIRHLCSICLQVTPYKRGRLKSYSTVRYCINRNCTFIRGRPATIAVTCMYIHSPAHFE